MTYGGGQMASSVSCESRCGNPSLTNQHEGLYRISHLYNLPLNHHHKSTK